MITLKFNIYNPTHSTHRYTQDTMSTKFFIFKPRTKSEIITNTITDYLETNMLQGNFYNSYKGSTRESLRHDLKASFKWAPTTRTAQNYSATISEYTTMTNAVNFITTTKLFSSIENFTKYKFGKINLLTESYYKQFNSVLQSISSSKATETTMVIKCKTMEVYEILETLSKNQHLLPEGNYSYSIQFLASIISRKLKPYVHS